MQILKLLELVLETCFPIESLTRPIIASFLFKSEVSEQFFIEHIAVYLLFLNLTISYLFILSLLLTSGASLWFIDLKEYVYIQFQIESSRVYQQPQRTESLHIYLCIMF